MVLLSVCLQTLPTGIAQTLPGNFHRLTPAQGLSQAINAFVYKDSRGFVWISSIDGLNRYDGQKIKVYRPNPANPHALRGANIQSRFYETPEGDLWFCTYEAINRYRRRTDDFESIQLRGENGDTIAEGYYIFHRDSDGKLWVRGKGKLYWFDPKTRRQDLKGAVDGFRCFVDTDAGGRPRGIYSCFFGSIAGIHYTLLNPDGTTGATKTFFTANDPAGLPPLKVFDIRVEYDTLVWLCGAAGLTAFNPRQPDTFRHYVPAPGGPAGFWAMAPVNDSLLAVSSGTSGLWLFNKNTRHFVRQIAHDPGNPRSPAALRCEDLNVDAEGNFWIAHWNTGLSFAHLHKQKFTNIPIAAAWPALNGRSLVLSGMVEDTLGRVWCSTEGAGIFVFNADGTPAADFSRRRDLPSPYITHLLKDRSNTIWVVERQHLYRYNAAANRFVEIPKPAGIPELLFAFETSGGRLLVGSHSGVFEVVTSPSGARALAPAAGFDFVKNDMLDWIYEDAGGNFYLGRNAATLLIAGKNGQREFPFGYVKAAWEAPGGRVIWLATTTGLVKMDKTGFSYTLYDESRGLPNQYLYSVIPDPAGYLWLSSNKGILRFDPRDGAARQYGAADGVWADEFYSHGWLRHSSGDVWLGNRDVLNVFRPGAVRDLAVLPKIQITNLKVNDLDWKDSIYIGERETLDFPFNNNTLSFEFVALEYSDPVNNRLRYRLKGYDDNWVEVSPGSPGFARYARLPPGHYTLQIMAANSDGVWNPGPHQLAIAIRPPFWQTWWFWSLAGALLAAAGYGMYRYRLRQIRREFGLRQLALEHELAARENALRAAESEMTALRAQMNPHFIFNCLNSISAYIQNNRGPEASRYLDQFARLMRQILDYSARPGIRLEDETAFLNNYLALESIRMNGRLTYEIRVAEDVDDFDTELPPMILQPFVENAIWHGLSPRPNGGRVLIEFKKENGALICTVEDNGVGRAQTRAWRAQQALVHESKGLKITAERLALHDQRHGTHSSVTTLDLLDDQGQAAGTRVEIKIEPGKTNSAP